MTLISAGGYVGGLVYPIMLNRLFQTAGFATGVRASAGLEAGMLLIALALLRPRYPERSGETAEEPKAPPVKVRKELLKFSRDFVYVCVVIA